MTDKTLNIYKQLRSAFIMNQKLPPHFTCALSSGPCPLTPTPVDTIKVPTEGTTFEQLHMASAIIYFLLAGLCIFFLIYLYLIYNKCTHRLKHPPTIQKWSSQIVSTPSQCHHMTCIKYRYNHPDSKCLLEVSNSMLQIKDKEDDEGWSNDNVVMKCQHTPCMYDVMREPDGNCILEGYYGIPTISDSDLEIPFVANKNRNANALHPTVTEPLWKRKRFNFKNMSAIDEEADQDSSDDNLLQKAVVFFKNSIGTEELLDDDLIITEIGDFVDVNSADDKYVIPRYVSDNLIADGDSIHCYNQCLVETTITGNTDQTQGICLNESNLVTSTAARDEGSHQSVIQSTVIISDTLYSGIPTMGKSKLGNYKESTNTTLKNANVLISKPLTTNESETIKAKHSNTKLKSVPRTQPPLKKGTNHCNTVREPKTIPISSQKQNRNPATALPIYKNRCNLKCALNKTKSKSLVKTHAEVPHEIPLLTEKDHLKKHTKTRPKKINVSEPKPLKRGRTTISRDDPKINADHGVQTTTKEEPLNSNKMTESTILQEQNTESRCSERSIVPGKELNTPRCSSEDTEQNEKSRNDNLDHANARVTVKHKCGDSSNPTHPLQQAKVNDTSNRVGEKSGGTSKYVGQTRINPTKDTERTNNTTTKINLSNPKDTQSTKQKQVDALYLKKEEIHKTRPTLISKQTNQKRPVPKSSPKNVPFVSEAHKGISRKNILKGSDDASHDTSKTMINMAKNSTLTKIDISIQNSIDMPKIEKATRIPKNIKPATNQKDTDTGNLTSDASTETVNTSLKDIHVHANPIKNKSYTNISMVVSSSDKDLIKNISQLPRHLNYDTPKNTRTKDKNKFLSPSRISKAEECSSNDVLILDKITGEICPFFRPTNTVTARGHYNSRTPVRRHKGGTSQKQSITALLRDNSKSATGRKATNIPSDDEFNKVTILYEYLLEDESNDTVVTPYSLLSRTSESAPRDYPMRKRENITTIY